MSSETIPEWAYAQAIVLVANLTDSLVEPEHVAPIANALLAAEQRGLEKAGPALAKAEQALKDWLHVYAPDLCKPEDVAAAQDRIGAQGTIAYIADALAAIRSLGEKT